MMGRRPHALSVTADPFHVAQVGWIIDFVAKNRLPTIYVVKENVFAGGLMSYGPSHPDLFRRAAGYVHKILQGGKFGAIQGAAPSFGVELTPVGLRNAEEIK